jgi:hypothetical protein
MNGPRHGLRPSLDLQGRRMGASSSNEKGRTRFPLITQPKIVIFHDLYYIIVTFLLIGLYWRALFRIRRVFVVGTEINRRGPL